MTVRTCFVVISHTVDDAFEDLVLSLRAFCPGADIAWYNSGKSAETPFDLLRVTPSRPLKYRKITPAFFDIFEWSLGEEYDRVVNVETDLAFIKPGFLEFLDSYMKGADYLIPGLRPHIPSASLWPVHRSLLGERDELVSLLGTGHMNRGFSPVQVFGRGYVSAVVSGDNYPRLRAFVERNQQPHRSLALQELILPSLADSAGVTARSYPPHLSRFNRYRPFQAPLDLESALSTPDSFFIHPIRRDAGDPVRSVVRHLIRGEPRQPGADGPGSRAEEHVIQSVRGKKSLQGADLSDLDLSGENLTDAMLRGAHLARSTLIGADLRGANLSGALLTATDLRGADLSRAFLGGAFLGYALLREADLSGAYLRGAELHESDLSEAHFNGADLSGAFLSDVVLRKADLRQANLQGTELCETDLSGALLQGASMHGAVLAEVTWDLETGWPSGEFERIKKISREDSPGRFVARMEGAVDRRVHIQHPWT